jgi:hypothetical protein
MLIVKKESTVIYLLKALVPYSRQNLALSYAPAKFFADLEKTTGRSQRALKQSFDRAIRSGLITNDPVPQLTMKGNAKVSPFVAKRLDEDAKLMIVFDVPEHSFNRRNQLRRLLRNLSFEQVQKSVWVTEYDHREVLVQAISELGLSGHVLLYECAPILTN